MVFGSTFDNGWNELLVKNVKVLSVAWLPNKVMDHYDTDEERKQATNEIIEKLKTLTPNVYTFDDGMDMLEWFKENGGHIDLNDFRKAEFGNYKKEDLIKSMGGLNVLINYDFDYFKNNFDKIKPLIIQQKDSRGWPYADMLNSAIKTGNGLEFLKMIFMANGRDWSNIGIIENLINRAPDLDNDKFFKWLLEFFGPRVNQDILASIIDKVYVTQEFVDFVFSVYGKTEDIINLFIKNKPNSVLFMGELNDEIQLNAIKKNPNVIRFLKNPSEELKMIAVSYNGNIIQHIQNPSEELQLAAVRNNYNAIHFLNNASEAVQIAAIKSAGSYTYDVIGDIKNPSEAAKLEAVNQNGYAIQFIDNPSEVVQIAAVKNKEQSYFYIKNPTDNVKRLVGVIDESRKNIRKILRS
jgi:hypothetical protein